MLSNAATIALALLFQQAPAEDVDWDAEFGVEKVERDPVTGELPVEEYRQSNANAGAKPFSGDAMAHAFGGQDGIRRITDRLVSAQHLPTRASPRCSKGSRHGPFLRRVLFEQFCYILNAGCTYTGRDVDGPRQLVAPGIVLSRLNGAAHS